MVPKNDGVGTIRNKLGDAHGRGPTLAHDVEAAHAEHNFPLAFAAVSGPVQYAEWSAFRKEGDEMTGDKPTTTTITIQQTAKKWKLLQLLGALAFAIGLLLGFFSAAMIGLVLACVGAAVYFVGKVAAWWYHG